MVVYTSQAGAEAEKQAIRKIVAIIQAAHEDAKGGNNAVRSWRMRFLNWQRKVEAGQANGLLSEDEGIALQKAVSELNETIDRLNTQASSIDLYSYPDELENFSGELRKLINETRSKIVQLLNLPGYEHYQDEIVRVPNQLDNLEEEADLFEEEINQYDQDLEDYDEIEYRYRALENEMIDAVSIENNKAGIELLGIDISTQFTRIVIKNQVIDDFVKGQVVKLENADASDLSTVIDLRPFGDVPVDYDAIYELLADGETRAIIDLLSKLVKDNAKKLLDKVVPGQFTTAELDYLTMDEPLEPEIPIMPVVEQMQLINISNYINSVDEVLLSELINYSKGAYANTLKHVDEINDLAGRIGADCPMIDYVEKVFDPAELRAAVDELEATYSMFIKGGEGNSSRGQTYIADLKSAASALRQVETLDDLKRMEEDFERAGRNMIGWFISAWFQFGGKPVNTNTKTKWKGAGGLKSAKRKR